MSSDTIDFSDPRAIDQLLESLDNDTLRRLNAAIVEHLKSQRRERVREQIARFSIGDRVGFVDREGIELEGTVVRLNIKSVSVITDDDTRWTVAPSLLTRLDSTPVDTRDLFSDLPPGGRPNADVIDFPGRQETTSLDESLETSLGTAPGEVPPEADWIVGILKAPGLVTGEGKPYRPDMLAAMDGNGMICGMQVFRPEGTQSVLVDLLRQIIEAPAISDRVIPMRVRVADTQLADVFETHYPQIRCVVAPTPELNALLEHLAGDLGSSDAVDLWQDGSLDTDHVRRFFTAASGLYLARPWTIIPNDSNLIAVSIPSLGIYGHVLCVIGQLRQEYGCLLFESLRDYLRFTLLGNPSDEASGPDIPAHRALSFEPGSDLPSATRRTISARGWPVANAKAYPVLRCIEEGGYLRKPTAADLDVFQCIADALVVFLKDTDAVDTALSTGYRVSTDVDVTTVAGTHRVSVATPYVDSHSNLDALPVLDELIALAGRHDDIALQRYPQLTEQLEAAFLASPEALAWEGRFEGYTIVMQLAFQYLDETIATLTPVSLQEILFELFPRKVMIGPDDAATIVDSLRTFYRFLGREYRLPQADGCLAFLNDDTSRQLAAHLSDPAKAGISKSILSGAIDAGVDIHSQEDLSRYLAATHGQPGFDPHHPSPTRKPATPSNPKARKKQRKEKRKARKKNR